MTVVRPGTVVLSVAAAALLYGLSSSVLLTVFVGVLAAVGVLAVDEAPPWVLAAFLAGAAWGAWTSGRSALAELRTLREGKGSPVDREESSPETPG